VTRTRSPSYTVVDVFTEPLSGNSLAVFPEASEFDAAGETIVVILADTGERYISTRLFAVRHAKNLAMIVLNPRGCAVVVGSKHAVTLNADRHKD
jgi:hypothetical protein